MSFGEGVAMTVKATNLGWHCTAFVLHDIIKGSFPGLTFRKVDQVKARLFFLSLHCLFFNNRLVT